MMILFGTFLIGIVFGSFYNVVAIRTLNGKGLSYPPSHCVNCEHKLSFWDLFPVLSWIFLSGKCRYCKVNISPIYPTIELLTGISYALIVYKFGFTMETLVQLVFITIMVLATASDLKKMIVPDRFVIVGLSLILILRVIYSDIDMLTYYTMSSIVAFSLLLLILILSKGKMGGADVKLYALIGMSIGWMDSIGSLFYASISALIFYIIIAIFNKNEINRKQEIPFVPFITVGVLCTYFLTFFNF